MGQKRVSSLQKGTALWVRALEHHILEQVGVPHVSTDGIFMFNQPIARKAHVTLVHLADILAYELCCNEEET